MHVHVEGKGLYFFVFFVAGGCIRCLQRGQVFWAVGLTSFCSRVYVSSRLCSQYVDMMRIFAFKKPFAYIWYGLLSHHLYIFCFLLILNQSFILSFVLCIFAMICYDIFACPFTMLCFRLVHMFNRYAFTLMVMTKIKMINQSFRICIWNEQYFGNLVNNVVRFFSNWHQNIIWNIYGYIDICGSIWLYPWTHLSQLLDFASSYTKTTCLMPCI